MTEPQAHVASELAATRTKAQWDRVLKSYRWLTGERRKLVIAEARKMQAGARQVEQVVNGDSRPKAPTVHNDRVEWQPSETGDADSFDAVENGYLMTVWKDDGDWFWLVKVTAEISETPETIDSGKASSMTGAQRGACTCVNRQR
jgi:hypothetical protein